MLLKLEKKKQNGPTEIFFFPLTTPNAPFCLVFQKDRIHAQQTLLHSKHLNGNTRSASPVVQRLERLGTRLVSLCLLLGAGSEIQLLQIQLKLLVSLLRLLLPLLICDGLNQTQLRLAHILHLRPNLRPHKLPVLGINIPTRRLEVALALLDHIDVELDFLRVELFVYGLAAGFHGVGEGRGLGAAAEDGVLGSVAAGVRRGGRGEGGSGDAGEEGAAGRCRGGGGHADGMAAGGAGAGGGESGAGDERHGCRGAEKETKETGWLLSGRLPV
mmetsp:Transcript_5644/g.13749  ORF Transcript_5644/g.13749 Transcript_5644/m.13749 type:complete len:272 (+) Transcript_5644:69-884(+)